MELKDTKNMSLEEKKAYLQELKLERQRIASGEQLRRQSGGFQAAAEAMMPYDPTGAFNLMDKKAKTDIDREEMLRKGQYDPDQVRFKLVSRMNSVTGQLRGMPANDPMYEPLKTELQKLQAELDSPNPSIQHVYSSGNIGDMQPPPLTDTVVNYESIIKDINAATKNTFESMKSKVATDKGKAALSSEQTKYIDSLIEKKYKELFPAEKKRPASTNEETRKLALNALGELIKWSEASKLNPEVASDRLLLAKIKSRGYANEAYMSDDATLSGGVIRQFFTKMTGVNELPKEDAIKFKAEIPANYDRSLKAVRKYLGDDYYSTVSKALYDNISETINTYPLSGSRDTTGGLRTNPKPVKGATKTIGGVTLTFDGTVWR